jgi:hypothetical protein
MIGYVFQLIRIGYGQALSWGISFADKFVHKRPNYETWLNQIVATYQTLLDGKDKTFSRFLLDLPSVPTDVLGLLRDLCVDAEKYVLFIFVPNRD